MKNTETQQTVVDRIVNLLNKEGFAPVLTEEEIKSFKEMEKEQHSKTWDASRVGYTGDSFRDSVFGLVKDFSEYYEETYGGDK